MARSGEKRVREKPSTPQKRTLLMPLQEAVSFSADTIFLFNGV